MSERWEETALLFFLSVGFSRWQKNKCAVLALAFLVQMFNFSTIFTLHTTFMYKESCVFVCEDFPKENQKLANKQLTLVLLKLAIFFIRCCA